MNKSVSLSKAEEVFELIAGYKPYNCMIDERNFFDMRLIEILDVDWDILKQTLQHYKELEKENKELKRIANKYVQLSKQCTMTDIQDFNYNIMGIWLEEEYKKSLRS